MTGSEGETSSGVRSNSTPSGKYLLSKSLYSNRGIPHSTFCVWLHRTLLPEANQDELIPPFRFIPNTDFEGSDIRKARGAMRFLLLEVGKLKILKWGQRIIELDYHAETNLRDTAIMNAYKHARSVRTVVAPDTLNKNLSKNITSLSFQTFYEHCSIGKLQQKYLAEHHIEPEFWIILYLFISVYKWLINISNTFTYKSSNNYSSSNS